MAVRTKRLSVGLSGAGGVGQQIYACPAGETTIVKDIELDGRADDALVVIAAEASGQFVNWFQGKVQSGSSTRLERWIVLQPGDALHLSCSATGGVAWWISGTQLEGVAD